MINVSRGRSFPRKVFDESGTYTVDESSHFLVESPSIQRYAEITYARRDLETALEMIRACSGDVEAHGDSPIEQGLWIGAVITYCKSFKRNNARKRFNAQEFIEKSLDSDGLDRHQYLLNLRDKMIAHDDGLGESKLLGLALHGEPPRYVHYVGIGGGRRRVVSMGTDIARELTPHVEHVVALLTDYESKERERTIRELLQSNFADVTLLGLYEEDELDVSQHGVLARFVVTQQFLHRSGR